MKKNSNRRVQTPKTGRNEEFAMATITRHAASARLRPTGAEYKRKPKHANRAFQEN